MEPQVFTFENGLRVIFVDTKTFPSLTALLLVGAGSRYENKDNNGIAHFFEHMAFKGSKKYPTALQISTLLDGLGSEHNAFTTKDHTGYWIKAPVKHFATVVDVLSEMILAPLLKEEEINREKGVIIEEINMYEDTPQYKVFDLFENLMFSDNPLGYDTVGRKETVTKFSRQTFLDYMGRYYYPNNSVLVVAGGLSQSTKIFSGDQLASRQKVGIVRPPTNKRSAGSLAQTTDSFENFVSLHPFKNYLAVIQEKFARWEKKKIKPFEKFKEKQNQPAVLVHHKKTEQAHLVLGFRGLSRFDQKRYVQAVLTAILGGGMSSRLFYELRERRGLCYYIHCGDEVFEETGYIYTRAGLNIDQKKINEAVKLIINEHEKIADGKLTDREIKKAKEMIKGRFILSLEDSNNLANFIGKKLLLEKKPETPEDVIKKIDIVTKNEIIDLAKKLVNRNKLNLAVIGPFDKDQLKV